MRLTRLREEKPYSLPHHRPAHSIGSLPGDELPLRLVMASWFQHTLHRPAVHPPSGSSYKLLRPAKVRGALNGVNDGRTASSRSGRPTPVSRPRRDGPCQRPVTNGTSRPSRRPSPTTRLFVVPGSSRNRMVPAGTTPESFGWLHVRRNPPRPRPRDRVENDPFPRG
jgi:hypothetical protein